MQLYPFDGDYFDRLRNGDPATEQHFINYFRELLRIKLRARYLSSDVVEDLQQETFIRFFRCLRQEKGIRYPERLGAFVNSICNNVLQEHYRSEGKKHQPNAESTDPPDKILNIEKLAITKEVNEKVRDAIKELAPREQDLIGKLFFKEMEKDEVCAQLGVSREYLRVLVHRAIEHLRESMENKDLGGNGPRPK